MQENLKECFTLIMCTVHSEKIEVNQCICVNVYVRVFYGIPVFLRYVGLPVLNFCLISIPV